MQTYLKLLSSIFGTGPKAKFKEPPVWNVWIMYLLVLSRTGVALSNCASSIWYLCSPGHGHFIQAVPIRVHYSGFGIGT